jgi:hypothetical protein
MLSVGSGGRPFSSFRPLLPKDIVVFAKGFRITLRLNCTEKYQGSGEE